ncbi:MAG: glycosyltransferase family 4 protein [Planctomycetota bacterium]|nr:glycosyltransferase family 4 protein [Planctomycetota bacterium]
MTLVRALLKADFGVSHPTYYVRYFLAHLRDKSSVRALLKADFDVFHPTYYDPYFLAYLHKPFVLTIHDMIHEKFPAYFNQNDKTGFNKKNLALKSSKIIAISASTKNDILALYPEIAAEKITVVYHGASMKPAPLDVNVEKENYLLFTGNRDGYKNFSTFAQAVAPLLLRYGLRLICTGRPFDSPELALLSELAIADRTVCRFAAEEELADLYAKAVAFIFPSLYEGFGIPILEAFAAGCPAILSNTSSLPEVGGDAAAYFDPYNVEEMRKAIESVITSPSLQKELVVKGRTRLSNFSWEKCAKKTAAVYAGAV